MKLLVCCIIIVANISNNGKASLDSFPPANANVLLEDTTRNSDNSCHRPCKFNVKPRRCHFKFKIEPSILDDERPAITINGVTPGPPINVCVNDVIIAEVTNKVPDQDLALHWHGIEQKGTPYMDGVPMITQCPISYGSTYKYAFIAATPGTYFYHADSVSHQSDGVFGALVVNQPQPLEPHSSLYDYDRSLEHTLLISAKYPQLLTGNLDTASLRPNKLVVNGEENTKLFMMPGFAYRLRLVNAIAVECPVVASVDGHELVVVAADGRPVRPAAAREVKLYPGERMDVVVRVAAESSAHWIRIRAESGACAGLTAHAMFLHSGFNYTSMLHNEKITTDTRKADILSGEKLQSLLDAGHVTDVKSIYLGIDRNVVQFSETDNDFRYISDAVPKKPFFPASLSLRESGVVQINNRSFLYPSEPVLLSRHRAQDSWCYIGEENLVKDPQCVLTLKAAIGQVLELALVNEGRGSNDDYTFHMHGYGMQVVATGSGPDNTPLSKEVYEKLDQQGFIKRNLQHPPVKDTVTVPNKGYTVIRIKPDHGGSWLLECRSCALTIPTALLINVPQSIPKAVLDSLPKCGNYKPPDVLLA